MRLPVMPMFPRLTEFYAKTGPYTDSQLSPQADQVVDTTPRTLLLQTLNVIQHQCGWIAPGVIQRLGLSTGLSGEEIRGIIDFYHFLQHEPGRDYHLYLSTNITDLMQGQAHHQSLFEQANLSHLQLRTTACTGMCDQGPAALINGYPLTRLTPQRVNDIIAHIRQRMPLNQWPRDWFAVDSKIHQTGELLGLADEPGTALRLAMQRGAQGILDELAIAQLRGRGGAGFSTASKWRFCQQATADRKYIVCNADEGEPGTFKDRVLLQDAIHPVLEGMTIAAATVGARQGFIYLRAEYLYLLESIEIAIAERRAQGLLGCNILETPGFDFDVQVHLGAGAYVCGEESALLESLEGRRGIPRLRPPFPVTAGYLQCPTIVNNVETFWCAQWIMRQGGAAFTALGSAGSSGNKLHSISGDCEQPGIYEFAYGLSIADMLDACGAPNAKAVQVGGPSGRLLTAEDFQLPLTFDQVSSGGSFMVFGPHRDLLDIVRNFTDFFRDESCGFCTPCRVGTTLLSQYLGLIAQGKGHADLVNQIDELIPLLKHTSHCGLGTTASSPLAHLRRLQPQRFALAATAPVLQSIES